LSRQAEFNLNGEVSSSTRKNDPSKFLSQDISLDQSQKVFVLPALAASPTESGIFQYFSQRQGKRPFESESSDQISEIASDDSLLSDTDE